MSLAPVIVNASLADTDISSILQQKGWRLRCATGTVEDSVIFPCNGPVFMVVHLSKAVLECPPDLPPTLNPDVVKRLSRGLQIHSSLYLLLISPLLGLTELGVLSALYERLPDLKVIATRDGKSCVDCMTSIVKVRQPETKTIIEQKYANSIGELDVAACTDVVNDLPFGTSVTTRLEERCLSISHLVRSTETELLEAGLDLEEATQVLQFFNKDNVIV